MRPNGALRDELLSLLQDAHAMEAHLADVLEKQVKATKRYPEIQAHLQEHLMATLQHRARMEARIRAYGESPSAVKELLSTIVGNMQGSLGGIRTRELMMNARDDYTAEQFEIATYCTLITTAQLFGDEETITAASENLRDEVAMAHWLQGQLVEATLLSLRENNIAVAADQWQQVHQRLEGLLHPALAAWPEATRPNTEPSSRPSPG
jgi:ferritin-like metal-binding protein YciE